MRIKLRQVEGFLAAADLLSFSRAADKIGMTQPAFSQLIRDLENALDVKLFDRSTRRVRITEVGLMSDQDLEEKFRGLVQPILPDDQASALIQACWDLPQLGDAGAIARLAATE